MHRCIETEFRLDDAGRAIVRGVDSNRLRIPKNLIQDVILPACRADFLNRARPFRLRSTKPENHTSFSLLSALLGLLDEELRQQPPRITRLGIPVYASAALAVEIAVLNDSSLNGRTRPSLAQARQLYDPAERYLVAEHAATLADAEAGVVDASVDRKGNARIAVTPVQTVHGAYWHPDFFSIAGGSFDDTELLDFFRAHAAGRPLPAPIKQASDEMRQAFGFGFESLLDTVQIAAEVRRRFSDRNFVLLSRSEVSEIFKSVTSTAGANEMTEALKLLVLDSATVGARERDAPLSLPTGPGARTATRPLIQFGGDYLATTPELITRGSIQLVRHSLDGRLPNGETPRPGTDLSRALDRLRGQRTAAFEESTRQLLVDSGFAVREISEGRLISAQIDAVAADPIAKCLWIVSVKDHLFPFRPKQAMEQIDRFFGDTIPQLQRNVRDVARNRSHIWHLLRTGPNGSSLPAEEPGWRLKPLLIFRDPPPAVAIAQAAIPAPIVLRRHLSGWAPGQLTPQPLNPAFADGE